MNEQTDPDPTGGDQGSNDQGSHDPAGTGPGTEPSGGVQPGPEAGEQMARKVVQDVSAFEVDPPPPVRVREGDGTGRTS